MCSRSAVLKQFIVHGGAASWIQMAVCQGPSKEGPGFKKCLMLLDLSLGNLAQFALNQVDGKEKKK